MNITGIQLRFTDIGVYTCIKILANNKTSLLDSKHKKTFKLTIKDLDHDEHRLIIFKNYFKNDFLYYYFDMTTSLLGDCYEEKCIFEHIDNSRLIAVKNLNKSLIPWDFSISNK